MNKKNEEEIKPPTPPPIIEKDTDFKQLPDHIDEYFKEQEQNLKMFSSRELFSAKNDDIDLKTDLGLEEIKLINTMIVNDMFLVKRGLIPVFSMYYSKYMRLKVSKDRLSRQEFVRINSEQHADELIQNASNIMGITGGKK